MFQNLFLISAGLQRGMEISEIVKEYDNSYYFLIVDSQFIFLVLSLLPPFDTETLMTINSKVSSFAHNQAKISDLNMIYLFHLK